MSKRAWIFGVLILVIGVIIAVNLTPKKSRTDLETTVSPQTTAVSPQPTAGSVVAEPVAQFRQRITKKFFGTYVEPGNSPVLPERFKGFHTAVDVEYEDVLSDVTVHSIADGIIKTSQTISGYGGVMVIEHNINGQTLFAVYGHLRPSSMKKSGAVKKGEQIGVLGTGYTSETDGARKHLHFGIATRNNISGYVADKLALSLTWVDPLTFYPQ